MKSSELSRSNRCVLRRNRDIATSSEKGVEYQKAIVVKNVLKNALSSDECTNVKSEIQKGFEDIDFPTEKTRELMAGEMTACIRRYLRSESRQPVFMGAMDLSIFDLNVSVAPDVIFYTSEGLEVVKFSASRPKITMGGTKRNFSANNSLELYSLFCFGKELVPVDRKLNVKASIYYLRKSNDSVNKGVFDADFFDEKGKNVVTISDIVDKTIHPEGAICSLDEHFKPLFEEFYIGSQKEDLTEEDCSTCDFKNICEYKYSPQYITKEHKVKSIKDLALTPQQEAAISNTNGISRINAGAGAGKTLVTALRAVTLMLNGVKPEEICLLTFTNSGADEMKERIQLYNMDFGTGADISKMTVTTFNGFANSIVQKEYANLGFTEPPTLIDDIERAGIIADLLKSNEIEGLDYRNFLMDTRYVKGALAMTKLAFDIIKKKKFSIGDEEELKTALGSNIRFMSETALTAMLDLFVAYDSILKTDNLIEYADQELLMFEVLRQNPYYFEKFGFKHIFVDEFQDSDQQQIDLIKELRDCPSFESLMVVGDDSQAIFSFRDTSPEYIINFFDIMGEEGQDYFLLENHRSTPEIIDLANKINALNKNRIEKDLIATRPSGKKPVVKGFFNKEDEYEFIVTSIKEKIESGTKAEDIAFIGSNKYELLNMGSELTKAGVPWVMLNPEPYLENPKVIAAIALAKAIKDPENTEAMLTYLNCLYSNELLSMTDENINMLLTGIKNEIAEVKNLPDIDKQTAYHDLITPLDDDDELYESFLDKIKRKKTFETELKYLLDFELYGANVTYKRCKDYPGVVLTTAHSSKGLEWNIVYNSITKYHGKELGSDRNSSRYQDRIEEKRRLLFVSLTRARDELYVTGQYVAFGSKDDRTYNFFLKDVYDCLGKEYNPIDPMEEEKERMKKEEAKRKAAERRAKEKEKIQQALDAMNAANKTA